MTAPAIARYILHFTIRKFISEFLRVSEVSLTLKKGYQFV